MKRYIFFGLALLIFSCKKEDKPTTHKVQLEIAARLFIIESKGDQGTFYKAERLSGLTSVNENHYFDAKSGETIRMSYSVVSPGLINIYVDGTLTKAITIGKSSEADKTITDQFTYSITP